MIQISYVINIILNLKHTYARKVLLFQYHPHPDTLVLVHHFHILQRLFYFLKSRLKKKDVEDLQLHRYPLEMIQVHDLCLVMHA